MNRVPGATRPYCVQGKRTFEVLFLSLLSYRDTKMRTFFEENDACKASRQHAGIRFSI